MIDMNTKHCKYCNQDKDINQFRIRIDKRIKCKGELIYRNNICFECEAKRTKERRERIKHTPEYKEYHRVNSMEYYRRNREKVLARERNRKSNPKHKQYMRDYIKRNYKVIKEQQAVRGKKWQEYQRDNITDAYCIGLIRSQNGGKAKCNITPEMIEQKRIQIKIKRKLYEVGQKINASGDYGRTYSVFQGTDLNGSNRPKNANNH